MKKIKVDSEALQNILDRVNANPDKYNKRVDEWEKAENERLFMNNEHKANIPAEYQDTAKARGRANKIKASHLSKWCLLIHGNVGTGKSWLATELFRTLLLSPALWISWADLELKGRNVVEKYLNQYGNIPVLLIDDLGAETLKAYGEPSFMVQNFIALVSRRYNARLKTIITSNLGLAEIEKIYGQRVSDRIKTGELINLTGKSRR